MPVTEPNTMHPSPPTNRQAVTVWIDGDRFSGWEGQTVAAVMAASGLRVFRKTEKSGFARGLFCGMGICYDCLVTIDGQPNQRACVTIIAPDMIVSTGKKGQNGA